MEDKSYSRVEKTKSREKFRVKIVSEVEQNSQFYYAALKILNNTFTVVENDDYDLSICFVAGDTLQFSNKKQELIELDASLSNLKAFFPLMRSFCFNNDESFSQILKKRYKIEKSLDGLMKNISKDLIDPSERNDFLGLLTKKKDWEKLYCGLCSIQTLPQALLDFYGLTSYESCQILVHEKGKLRSDSFLYKRHLGLNIHSHAVESFNDIFSFIKKRKNRSFNQSKLLKNEIDVVGTFLAVALEQKNYRVLIIVSRNDFLQPTLEEENYFFKVSTYLSPVLDRLLLNDFITTKNNNLILALQHIPLPIAIIDGLDNVIFKNNYYVSKELSEPESQEDYRENCFNLSRRYKLVCWSNESDNIATDIHHFRRISLLGELLNTLQHELSNPLFGITLSSDLLFLEFDDNELKEFLKNISESSNRCQTIIRNFSLLYTDCKTDLYVDIKKIIDEASILAKSETRGISRQIESVGLPKEEPLYLKINPTWLTQIIFNLIINSAQAIKAIGDDLRYHKISITLSASKEDGKYVIAVKDTGTGISPEVGDKVFSPFFTTKSHGTGLGLSICKNLADRMCAKLSFRSNNPLPGTTFSLELPSEKNTFN